MSSKFIAAAKYFAAGLAILALVWVVLAWRSGAFTPHDQRWAVAPGETTSDGFAQDKQIAELPDFQGAYVEIGSGPPLILLHGCPFSGYEWREIIPRLAQRYRVIVPDLIGLGDTPVRLNDDYRLPRDVLMVRQLMDHLDIPSASFIAHDHGGATLLLMMNAAPERIDRVILTNIEAYDLWPSKPELPYLQAIVNPVTSPILYHAFQMPWLRREAFGVAFHDPDAVSDDTYLAFTAQHIASPERWQRLRRFFRWQLDPTHNRITMDALPGMNGFTKPVLLLWGQQDENFGSVIAERLVRDIPGAVGVRWMQRSAHMPMLEEPALYADAALAFLAGGAAETLGEPFEPAEAIRGDRSAAIAAE